MSRYTESDLELATIEWFEELGYQILGGPDIEPGSPQSERKSFSDTVLVNRLENAIKKINQNLNAAVIDEAIKKIIRITNSSPILEVNNREFHKLIFNGVEVEYQRPDGSLAGGRVKLIDTENLDNNDWLVVNQFTVIENGNNRRPDVVIFINGIPIGVIELKNPADENASVKSKNKDDKSAYNQIQTYKNEIPSLLTFNELIVIADGLEAYLGTITSPQERFSAWRSIEGDTLAPNTIPQLEVLLKGVFAKNRLLDIITNFIVFQADKDSRTDTTKFIKKIAGYHQYHATNKAVISTKVATAEDGDRRCGVVWHTQGSGKSLTMTFYAGKIVQVLNNPTIVVITDRNDLDDQLFGTFASCSDLLRQTPKQAGSRDELQKLLKTSAGGVIFTTIQKFLPDDIADKDLLLTDRKNVVVIADEAHRSQYGFIHGFAQRVRGALPNASFIGFTGTPVELGDRNTQSVFGKYIDVYNITQAVEDHATVPIYYESRLAKIDLKEEERPKIDPEFDEITEGEEETRIEKLKSKWARLEAMVGSEKRLKLIAKDIVDHFEKRTSAMEGKGMIVTMSRRIAVELYNEIIALRPLWHNDDEKKGFIKVVMTGSAADPEKYQPHIHNKESREMMADRMKDSTDELKLVIVRDMWLTGFDVPALHSMYIDKPMRGHNLMQAIARVNRVWKDKPGGLIIDYLGIAAELKEALSYYAESDKHQAGVSQAEAVSVMLEKYEITRGILSDFEYKEYFKASPARQMSLITEAINFLLMFEDGKKRFSKSVSELSSAFALSVPSEEAMKIREEVGFFQAVRAGMAKLSGNSGPSDEDYDVAIRQIISGAVTSDKVIDIFSVSGIKAPDISILSDEFLEEVKQMKHKNVAVELLRRLLNDKVRLMNKTSLVKSRAFSQMLEDTIRKYQNRTIEAIQVLVELIELAKTIRKEQERGANLGLNLEETAFYDALCDNESAVLELGDKTLQLMSKELVMMLKKNTTIDWTIKESVQARLRIMVKRLLHKYHYPPDKQELATVTVLEQANLLCRDWTGKENN